MKLSQRIQSVAESATLAVTARAAQMRAEGIDVISFGAGEPDFPTPPHIVEAARKALTDGQTKYPKPASGLAVLKTAVCAKLRRENDLEYTPQQVMISVGGKDAVYGLMQALLDPGDEVIIPVPYWVSYPEMAKLAGAVPVFVEGKQESGFCVTPDQVRDAITARTRLFIFNSPSNPGGHVYNSDQVRAIAGAFAGTDVTVVSDEIYDRLVYDDEPCLSFAATGDDAYQRTVTLNSASKTYSMTGWRLGFAAGSPDIIKAMAKLQSQSTSGAATFSQIAYAAALDGDQSCVSAMRDEFARRGRFMCEALNAIDGIRCNPAGGAFYVFPDVSGTFERLSVTSSHSFAAKLLEDARVAVVPGGAFGMDTNVRLSFATGMDQIETGLDRIAKLVKAG